MHRLEEKLWGSRAAILHHPRRSGGLSHTSPSICGERKKEKSNQATEKRSCLQRGCKAERLFAKQSEGTTKKKKKEKADDL